MRKSLFTPIINVADDGTIDIDWTDSYENTFDTETNEIVYDEPEGQPHSSLLDSILGFRLEDKSTPAALRRLADYMETKGAPSGEEDRPGPVDCCCSTNPGECPVHEKGVE